MQCPLGINCVCPDTPKHVRRSWTETDEALAIWDEEENGYVMFPRGGKHRKDI